MPPPPPDAPAGKLDGWKAIADHLGRDERTAQRWRKERGMPVYRVPGGKGGSVFAYPTELEAWLRNHLPAHERDPQAGNTAAAESPGAGRLPSGLHPDPRNEPDAASSSEPLPRSHRPGARLSSLVLGSPARVLAVTTVLVGGALVVAVGWMHASPRPDRVEFSENAFTAWRGSQVVWRREILPSAETHLSPSVVGLGPGGIRLVDITGDGEPEVLTSIRLDEQTGDGSARSDEFYCLSARGSLLWTHKLDRVLEFSGHRFDGPWLVRDWIVVPGHGRSQIWVASAHRTWWPSFVESVAPTGAHTLRFVNAGHINSIAYLSAPSGSYMLAAGVNNEYAAAMLAVLSEDAAPATAPAEPQSPYRCISCPAGRPDRYFLFPRSELGSAMGVPYNMVYSVRVTDGGIEISVREVGDPQLRSIYRLSRNLDVRSVAMSDAYWEIHRRFEREGRLNHPVEQCDEWRKGKEVRAWTRETGWTSTWVKPEFGIAGTE